LKPSASDAAAPGATGRRRLRRFSGKALSAGPVVFAFLLPKCPLCFAVWAGALGVGAAGQRYLMVPWLRPVLMALLLSPLLMQLAFAAHYGVRRLRSRSAGRQSAAYITLSPALSPISRSPE